MAEALRTYLNLLNNLSEATRNRVTAAGRALLAQAGLEEAAAETSERVMNLVDEIANAGRANRQMLGSLVGAEVEQLVARLGFARTDEIDLLRDELVELRARLVEAERAAAAASASGPDAATPPRSSRVTRAPGEKAPRAAAAKKAAASPATKSASQAPVATKSTAKRSTAKKSAAKKSTAKKSTARRAAAGRAVADEAAASETSPTSTSPASAQE